MPTGKTPIKPLEEDFWKKITKGDGCWEWNSTISRGYGVFSVGRKAFLAHRVVWELTFGPIPSGIQVNHKCGNRACVRPEHLLLGTVENRFWAKVRKGNGCWEWSGGRDRRNYGHLEVNRRNILAHRFSWTLHFGPIPKGMLVCHSCDNPGCVRPDHLFLGTKKDNAQDAKRKGRKPKGENHPSAKLTNEQVEEIRRSPLSSNKLGRIYKVSSGWIRSIKRGER